jgi:drug/metabolite transporter (DMT)-like permease
MPLLHRITGNFCAFLAINFSRNPQVENLTGTGLACIFYFAFFGTTLGFIWFYDGVKKLGASRAVMYVNLVPVSGVLLGTLLLGEHPDPSLLVGGIFVFLGIYLINQNKETK